MVRHSLSAARPGESQPVTGHIMLLPLLLPLTACGSAGTSPDSASQNSTEVAVVRVDPSRAEITEDDTLRLSVTLFDAVGDQLQRSVTWKSTAPLVADVGSEGLVQAHKQGTALISAHAEGTSDTSTVVVVAPQEEEVDSVHVRPDSASLRTGSTAQLSATVTDASGDTLDRAVTWSSEDPSVASVSDSGVVTGEASGTTQVEATTGGESGSAVIVVEENQAASAECSDPEPAWIWCDDFEEDRRDQYFEVDRDDGDFIPVAGVGFGGSTGMRVTFQEGEVGAGSLHLGFGKVPSTYFRPVDDGTRRYREIYWRMYLKHSAGWQGGGGHKLSRATSFATSGWAQAMIAHVWSGSSTPNYLSIDPASGTDETGILQTTGFNDFENLRWLGAEVGDTPLFDSSQVGQWYCIEVHVQLNDPGASNGLFELWIDGNLDARRSDLNWVGEYEEFGINAIFFENYWNGGAPAAQERYFDNLVVSTEPIGCQTG